MAQSDIYNPGIEQFTEDQLGTLKAINIVTDVLLALNLSIATYILVRLIIPLKIKGVFIVQFYVVSVLLTLLRMFEVTCLIRDPRADMWEYSWHELSFFRLSGITATCTFYALGLLVISTMFQIAVSIQVMLGRYVPTKGKRILLYFNCILVGLLLNIVFFSYAG